MVSSYGAEGDTLQQLPYQFNFQPALTAYRCLPNNADAPTPHEATLKSTISLTLLKPNHHLGTRRSGG